MASSFKKDQSKIGLLTNINMLLMVEKSIRGGICNAVIHWYAKVNDKYMNYYDENKELS